MTLTANLNKGTNDKRPRQKTVTRRLTLRIASLGLALAAVMLTASPASAATVTAQTANHGSYALFKTTAGVDLLYHAFLNTGGISVWRSPAVAGTQRVTVEYKIWRYTAQTGWMNVLISGAPTAVSTMDLQPGYYAPFRAQRFNLDTIYSASYAIQWTIRWKYTTGVEFASVNIGYNAGDYTCVMAGCSFGTVQGVATVNLVLY